MSTKHPCSMRINFLPSPTEEIQVLMEFETKQDFERPINFNMISGDWHYHYLIRMGSEEWEVLPEDLQEEAVDLAQKYIGDLLVVVRDTSHDLWKKRYERGTKRHDA